jgi:hypothetical protein
MRTVRGAMKQFMKAESASPPQHAMVFQAAPDPAQPMVSSIMNGS